MCADCTCTTDNIHAEFFVLNNPVLGSKDFGLNVFKILFCMCWQTENKTYLVYVLGIAQRCMFQALSLS